jgi:hypothetical protein
MVLSLNKKSLAAFTIQSVEKETQSPIRCLFEFLSDFKNFDAILPKDKIEDFKYSENECSFNIKGITPLTIKLNEKKAYDFIVYNSQGLSKFNFTLKVFFHGSPTEKGECKIELTGDLNPFIKAMAEKPLSNLVDQMSLKLSELQLN